MKEALKLALEALERINDRFDLESVAQNATKAIFAIKEALAQDGQEPVAYDKTKMNCFVQDLYDKKMQEGKHGHYETMFHVVHQAIKKVPPQRKPLPPQSPCEMTQAEGKMFKLGWLECEAAHGIKEKNT